MEREEIEAALDVWAAMELPDRDTLWRGAIDQCAGQVTADSTPRSSCPQPRVNRVALPPKID